MNIQQAKALFFAQYLWQQVFKYEDDCSLVIIYPGILNGISEQSHLSLRTVNQLTDEEVIVVSQLQDEACSDEMDDYGHIHNGKYIISQYRIGEEFSIKIYQYLLRIGILLPLTYLNEENKPVTLPEDEIVSLGWAKVELQEGKK